MRREKGKSRSKGKECHRNQTKVFKIGSKPHAILREKTLAGVNILSLLDEGVSLAYIHQKHVLDKKNMRYMFVDMAWDAVSIT